MKKIIATLIAVVLVIPLYLAACAAIVLGGLVATLVDMEADEWTFKQQ